MKKIVFGIELEGYRVSDQWEVRTWEVNGVMERSVRQVVHWEEVADHGFHFKPAIETLEDRLAALLVCLAKNPTNLVKKMILVVEGEIEANRLRDLKRAASRAKQQCRRAIITERFDEMLTLTYRENQGDRSLCKKHFKEWVRRMTRSLPGFRYCASFEKQERGAMHVHCATHRLPQHAVFRGVKVKAWELGTKIWRSIVGENNGMCFVGAKTRFGTSRRSKLTLAKMASYVSKYIMKDYEKSPAGSNRYSRSVGSVIEKPTVIRITDCSLLDIIQLTFELGEGDILISHRLGCFKDSLWFCKETPSCFSGAAS